MSCRKKDSKMQKAVFNELNTKKRKKSIVAAVVIVSALLMLAVSFAGCSRKDAAPSDGPASDSAATEAQASAEPSFVKMVEDDMTYLIDIGFVSLRYPKEYEEAVTISGAGKYNVTDQFTLRFISGETELFDLYFNEDEGDLLGTIITDEGNSVVRVKTFALDRSETELIAQQESLNVIIHGLISDYGFLVNEEIEEEDNAVFEIKTDVVSLYYPQKWKDKVEIKIDGNTVSFVSDGTPIFDLCFETCDGYLLGTYKDTPIYIIDYAVKGDEQIAMQQDVNVIIDYLSKDKEFKINA